MGHGSTGNGSALLSIVNALTKLLHPQLKQYFGTLSDLRQKCVVLLLEIRIISNVVYQVTVIDITCHYFRLDDSGLRLNEVPIASDLIC